ncbi:quinol monooxygenase YgiN [Salegentibacter sp. 24]|uniref:carboxymuconolactone decarboxylase family protein n=1 Tax=Salegentibacter sp. 24 TaxID=2183986 RepID=UPI00106160FC|nr:carboxymuconolactone decarboxylase family protein [Salegentibacter sp. 24]TDN79345.1 quinol monooxygenase YgiN [Salegentibacter sp. 24]
MKYRKYYSLLVVLLLILNIDEISAQNDTQDLDATEKGLSEIAMFTASGDLEQLNAALNNGLDAGLTINEIKESLVQLYAYCGFPRSLNAINTFRTIVENRESNGINDPQGKPIQQNNSSNKYEQGRKVLEEITRKTQPKPAPGFGEFSPRVDVFLKEHLFADIFASDVLSYKQRELITISALAAMTGVEPQLKVHVEIGKNTGVTDAELENIATLVEENFSNEQANTLKTVIGKPLLPTVEEDMLVRISEIEIYPEYLEEYKSILKEEASASVKLEPGVISIFPMFQKENPNLIRILEIYKNQKAYKSHLQTSHFKHYKSSTLEMVKDLKLIDMKAIDSETMDEIFQKL